MDSVELSRYLAAVELESEMWRAVGMRVPGSRDFCEQAWTAWTQAASAATEARAKWEGKARLKARLQRLDIWRNSR